MACEPRALLTLIALLLGALAPRGEAQYKGANTQPRHYDEYELYDAGYESIFDDSYSSGVYEEELAPYDDYFEDYEARVRDCRLGPDGTTPQFNETRPCDVKVEGADRLLKGLRGGLDGLYAVHSCENGKASYLRKDSARGEERLLWYSSRFSDWDINNGTVPREDDVLLFGKGGGQVRRPELVGGGWKVDTLFLLGYAGKEEYDKLDLTLACGDGSKTELPSEDRWGKRPLLTDDEVDFQYSQVYNNARLRADTGESHGYAVAGWVLGALACLTALACLAARRRRLSQERGGAPVSLQEALGLKPAKRGRQN